ncbi:chemotaxis protein chel [Paracoccus ravus]|uniref:chemotaxis protein chel n=1 Tax=Paracoccus ravus TaxID=2447760 RepID=UPI001FD719C5|nr:chemotaxis protein chel [Paracoccus ravus]
MEIQNNNMAAISTAGKKASATTGIEKLFLAEMLKVAGPKPISGAFGGGIGEEQFFSWANEITAESIAKRIDLGLGQAL